MVRGGICRGFFGGLGSCNFRALIFWIVFIRDVPPGAQSATYRHRPQSSLLSFCQAELIAGSRLASPVATPATGKGQFCGRVRGNESRARFRGIPLYVFSFFAPCAIVCRAVAGRRRELSRTEFRLFHRVSWCQGIGCHGVMTKFSTFFGFLPCTVFCPIGADN